MSAVRDVILENLPDGYVETARSGMLSYEIPLDRYPKTYNKLPLSYAALAAQKNYYALHLMNVYQEPGLEAQLREAFRQAGKKLDDVVKRGGRSRSATASRSGGRTRSRRQWVGEGI